MIVICSIVASIIIIGSIVPVTLLLVGCLLDLLFIRTVVEGHTLRACCTVAGELLQMEIHYNSCK